MYAGVSGAESSRYIAVSAGRTLESIDKTTRLRPGCVKIMHGTQEGIANLEVK